MARSEQMVTIPFGHNTIAPLKATTYNDPEDVSDLKPGDPFKMVMQVNDTNGARILTYTLGVDSQGTGYQKVQVSPGVEIGQ